MTLAAETFPETFAAGTEHKHRRHELNNTVAFPSDGRGFFLSGYDDRPL